MKSASALKLKMDTNKFDKKEIRALALARRRLIGPAEKAAKDFYIRERLWGLDIFKDAKTALFYASFKDEVDTLGLIEGSLLAGKRVMLPKVQGPELKLYHITGAAGLNGLVMGFMGIIPEPAGDGPEADINEADIVIVPGVAFDLSGGRLGYGKGYYDKLLALRAKPVPLVALAYETQIFDRLPLAPHDILMDCIITEERTLWINAKGGEK